MRLGVAPIANVRLRHNLRIGTTGFAMQLAGEDLVRARASAKPTPSDIDQKATLTTVNIRDRKQPTNPKSVQDQNGEGIDAHPQDLPLRPEDKSRSVDTGQQHT